VLKISKIEIKKNSSNYNERKWRLSKQ